MPWSSTMQLPGSGSPQTIRLADKDFWLLPIAGGITNTSQSRAQRSQLQRYDSSELKLIEEFKYDKLPTSKKRIRLLQLKSGTTHGPDIFCELIEADYDNDFHIPTRVTELTGEDVGGEGQETPPVAREGQDESETQNKSEKRNGKRPEIPKSNGKRPSPATNEDRKAQVEASEKFAALSKRAKAIQYEALSKKAIQYEALSWCWGTDAPEYALLITYKGTTYKKRVRKELGLALKYLRLPNKIRTLWIDAICINQDDHNERNHQVQMMSRIYTRASEVCVWLGEDSDESKTAIDFIHKEIMVLDNFDTLCTDKKYTEKWRALMMLMQREWFSRRWVVQEIALASKAKIYCGPDSIWWNEFAVAVELFVEVETATHRLSEIMQKDEKFRHVPGWFEHVSELGASLLVQATGKVFRAQRTPLGERNKGAEPELTHDDTLKQTTIDPLDRRSLLSLEYLVSTLFIFKATEPRDAVYALLAIARDASPFAKSDSSYNYGDQSLLILSVMSYFLEEKPFVVDYSRPYSDVCRDFVEFTILRKNKWDPVQALDILCRPWALDPPQGKSIHLPPAEAKPGAEREKTERPARQWKKREYKVVPGRLPKTKAGANKGKPIQQSREQQRRLTIASARRPMTEKPNGQDPGPSREPAQNSHHTSTDTKKQKQMKGKDIQEGSSMALKKVWRRVTLGRSSTDDELEGSGVLVSGPSDEGDLDDHVGKSGNEPESTDDSEGQGPPAEPANEPTPAPENGVQSGSKEAPEEQHDDKSLDPWNWPRKYLKPEGMGVADPRDTKAYWKDALTNNTRSDFPGNGSTPDWRQMEESPSWGDVLWYFPGREDQNNRDSPISANGSTLPSWVARASLAPFSLYPHPGMHIHKTGRSNADPLVGQPQDGHRNYSAAQTNPVDLKALKFRKREKCGHYSLYVRGFILDTVETVLDASQGGNIPKSWLDLGGWFNYQDDPPDHFWRTLVADRGRENRNPPYYYTTACKESILKGGILSGRVNTADLINNERNSIVAEFCRRVQAVIWSRRLFKTKNHGVLGLASEVQRGDQIAIIYGCTVPVILRRRKKVESSEEKSVESILKKEAFDDSVEALKTCLQRLERCRERKKRYEVKKKEFEKEGKDYVKEIREAKKRAEKKLEELAKTDGKTPSRYLEVLKSDQAAKEVYYEFNGEAYVHGMMDGEALRMKFYNEISDSLFELR